MTAHVLDRIEGRLRFLPKKMLPLVQHLLHAQRLPNLVRPQTFSEHLALKNLQPSSALVRQTTDKVEVRKHVAEHVGADYLIPQRAVFDDASQISALDIVDPCVIKATHGCDMTMLVGRGEAVGLEEVRSVADGWLRYDFAGLHKESAYEGLSPRVVVEDFLGDGDEPPDDFKFYVFNGSVGMVQIDTGRFSDHRSSVLDHRWRPLAIEGVYPAPEHTPEPPAGSQEMMRVAERLAAPFSFARVDLYNVDGRTYFGEITHNPGGGKLIWKPKSFDRALGDLWRYGTPLPERFLCT